MLFIGGVKIQMIHHHCFNWGDKMKRTKVLLFVLVLVMFGLFFSGAKFRAAEIQTSDEITVLGAQVRTDDPLGIRFVGKAEGEYDKYGIAIAFGKATAEEVVLGATVNGEVVLSAEASSKDEDGQFYISLISIPENMYVQDVTARAYVVKDGVYTYSTEVAVRNLAQVSLAVKNAGGEVVESVLTYVEANYMNYYEDLEGNHNINKLYEWNPASLEKVFVKDWNTKFGTELTEMDADDFFESASTGFVSRSDTDARVSNIYKFFNDDVYSSKWGWFLDYLLEFADVHPKRQINAIKNPEGTCTDNYGSGMNFTSHLCYSISNFFNKANQSGGYAPIDFTKVSKYSTLLDYNNVIYSSDLNLVKIGNAVSLPSALSPEIGYSWDGWYAGAVKYEADSNYVVTSETVKFVPQFVVNYDMSVIYVDENATSETTSCNGSLVKLGINIFNTISEAVAAVEAGKTVIVMPGTYSENVKINKNLTLKTLNESINPTVDIEKFENNQTKVELSGVVYVNALAVKIYGFTFTGAGMIAGYGTISPTGITIKNNYFNNTNDRTFTYSVEKDLGVRGSATVGTVPGVVSLAYNGWTKNANILNNVFSNINDYAIYISSVHGVTISGNKFIDVKYDSIRFNALNNYGTINFTDNVFENIKYSAIYMRGITYQSTAGASTVNIKNNTFTKVATNETKIFDNVYIGCVATRNYQEYANAIFNIEFNDFNNCGGYINVRTNYNKSKAGIITVNVNYNSFIQSSGTSMYSRTSGSNQKSMTFNNNYYGTDANTKVIPTTSQYDANTLISIDQNIFDTLAALKEAIANLK